MARGATPVRIGAPALAAIAAALGLGAAATLQLPLRVVYNPSDSAPHGFYWIGGKPVRRGDIVVLRMPDSVRALAAQRAYLPADTPLIKRVAAMGGDEICRFGAAIFINGERAAIALKRDARGRALPVWSGCRQLGASEIFVLQDHPYSFDGRYFGPVQRSLVIGRAYHLSLYRPRGRASS